MNDDIIGYFESLSADEIGCERVGKWGDNELLDVLQEFHKEGSRERATAVMRLILRSPERSEMVDYPQIYSELAENEERLGNYPASLRWLYALLAYEEQHNDRELNQANAPRDLASLYLNAGDLDTGLAIFTRLLKADPTDMWTYNLLGCWSPAGLSELSVEVLTRGLELLSKKDPEGLKSQFEQQLKELMATGSSQPSTLHLITPTVLAEFRGALQTPAGLQGYLPPLDRLLNTQADIPDALTTEILAQGKVLAMDLIRLAFDKRYSGALPSRHAVALLRLLKNYKIAQLDELKSWLDREDCEFKAKNFGKIGGHTVSELEALVTDTGYNMFLRAEAANALVELALSRPGERGRVTAIMRNLLNRPEAPDLPDEETFLGFLVCSILELDARELYPDIEAAFREDRVDTKVVDLKSVQTDWRIQGTLPPKRKGNGFNLLLRCVECGREREHFVERVMRDTGTIARKAAGEPVKYDSFIMDREIICPKCGSRDRYEMTPLAMLSLVTPASRMNMFSMGEMPGSEFDPRVISFCSVVFGAPMHPLDGLDKYRELIAANPREPINYIRMGNLLRTTFRSSQALEAFRAGYALGVDDPELLTSVALGEHDFGNRVAARSLYERVIALTSTKCHIVPRMNELLCSAKGGLDLLVKGKGSSWDCPGRPDPVKKDTHPPKRKPKKKR